MAAEKIYVDWRDIDAKRNQGQTWREIGKELGLSDVSVHRAHQTRFTGYKQPRLANVGRTASAPTPTRPGKHGEREATAVYVEWRQLAARRKAGATWAEIVAELGGGFGATSLSTRFLRKADGWIVPRTPGHRLKGANNTGRDYAAERERALAKAKSPASLAKVNASLAKSNGHKPIAQPTNGNGHDSPIEAAIRGLLPMFEEYGVIYAEIDARGRNAKIAQVKTISLDPH